MSRPGVEVVSVNTGGPAPLSRRRGRLVRSAIRKHPVDADTLPLSTINLEGDDQADRTVHGGVNKALYVYPVEHLRAWAAEHPEQASVFVPGGIGENLTVRGWTEDEVRVGDVWHWGDAVLQVAQPRSPCWKLAARSGIPALTRLFEQSGRSGWYLRVLRPCAAVPVRAPLRLEVGERGSPWLTVRRCAWLRSGAAPRSDLLRALDDAALAAEWRRALQQRLDLADNRALA